MVAVEITAWLERHGLGQYAEVLAENDVDLDVLPQLSDDDLKELGLSLGHRRKLLAALREPESRAATAPAPEAEPAPATETAAPADEAERRQLTVMFCDLVGSTELSQRLDPEEFREVLRRYDDSVTGAVTAHDGHVAKLLGDGVLAYFGWPNAHEDDAERAIRAALDAVAAVARIDAGGAPLAARAGIATGPVVIGDMHGETARERGSVAGATPNLAARLQGAAAPGDVVIPAATRRLVGAVFKLDDMEPQRLKGFVDPVALWRVAGLARTGSRFEAQHGGGLTAFVGRAHDISLMQDRWRLARDGEGQVVLLSGEAGIGKSRALREFNHNLDGTARRVLRYQCSPHETNAAFQPVIAEIEDTAGFHPDEPPATRLDKLENQVAEAFPNGPPPEAAPIFAALLGLPTDRYQLVEMAPQRRKQRTIKLLVERLAGLARLGPALVLVEDIHWVDPSTLEVLDALVARVRDLPVLMVMTYRPEFQPQWSSYSHVTVHSLNRLGRADGRAIAERVAGDKALPNELLGRIVAQTDGIPLFVEELTKTVLEAGLLEEREDRYVLNGPLPTLAIPATLQDSLMARLDRLAPVKRVIQAAACIGREFGAGLLAAALPMTQDELDDALDQLLAAELIFRHGGTGEEARYIFKHALVQDAAYASLLTPARRSLHEQLALALEKSDDPDTLELARHFREAGAHVRAAELYLSAGQHAVMASALPEAIGALELGLQAASALEPSADRDRLELSIRVALGTARMANFGWAHPSVSEALELAFPLAKGFGDQDALGSILWGLWVHYQTRTEFPRAWAWLDELETVAQDNPKSNLPLINDMSVGCQYLWEAKYRQALEHTDHLRTIYDPQRHADIAATINHDPLVFAQHWAGSLAAWIIGHPDRSVERLEEAVALARQIAHPFNSSFAMTAGVTSLLYLGRGKDVLAYANEVERIVENEALGSFAQNVLVNQWRGSAHIFLGQFETGYPLVKQGNDFWNMAGGRICNAMFRSWVALGLRGLGRIGEANELIDYTVAHCRETGDCYMEPECVRLKGVLALQTEPSSPEAAEQLFREAINIAQAHGAKSWELRAAMSMARLLQARGQRKEAVACLEPILEWFTEGLGTADLIEATALMSSLD